MQEPSRINQELSEENAVLTERVQELEKSEIECKRLSEALKESKELLAVFFSLSPASMAITRMRDGILIDVNKAWEDVTGLNRDEIIGRTTAELNIWVDGGDRERLFNELKERGKVRDFESQLRHKSGSVTNILMTMERIEMEGGQYFLGVAQDITNRKKAEENLKQSEKKFAEAFLKNAIPAAITTFKEGRYIEVSESFLTLMGLERSEVVGNTSTGIGFITLEQRTVVLNEFAEKGFVANLELQIRTKGGECRYGLLNSVLISFSGEDHLLTMVIDITDRKGAEEKAQNLSNFLQTLFNTIPSPIFCKDINGLYQDFNKEFEAYTGKTRKEIIGKGVYEMYPQHVADKYNEKDLALFLQPGRQIYEHPIIYADGTMHDVIVNKATYKNVDGAIAGLVGVMVDITERKRAEEELARHREKLEHLVEERTRDLDNKTKALEEVNIALKVLLQQREQDKKELEERFVMNVKNLIMPFTEKMKNTRLDERQLAYLSIIKSYLTDITSAMAKKMHQFNFTPTEIEVASLIKDGKSTKEIAQIMGTAESSVNTHRNNIRKKLGISNKDANLRSQLRSLD